MSNESQDKVITVPTMVSTGGLLSFQEGVRRGIDTPLGLAIIALSKLLDNVDGALARNLPGSRLGEFIVKILPILQDRLGASEFGAKADPAIDRITNLEMLIAAWIKNTAPKEVLATIAALEVLKTGANGIDAMRHPSEIKKRRPTTSGKIGTFAHAVSVVSYSAMTKEMLPRKIHKALQILSVGSFTVGTVLNIHAAYQYIQRALGDDELPPAGTTQDEQIFA